MNNDRELTQELMSIKKVFNRDHGLDESTGTSIELQCNAGELVKILTTAFVKDTAFMTIFETAIHIAKITLEEAPEMTELIRKNSLKIDRQI